MEETKTEYLKTKGWRPSASGYWVPKDDFLQGKLSLSDAYRLQQIMDSWWQDIPEENKDGKSA